MIGIFVLFSISMFKIHPGLGFWMWCYSHSLSAGASLLRCFLSGLNLFLTCVPAWLFSFLLLLHSILYFIIVLFPRWFINVTVIFMASAIEFSCGVWEIGGHRILWCLWFINCLFLGRPLLSRMSDSALFNASAMSFRAVDGLHFFHGFF